MVAERGGGGQLLDRLGTWQRIFLIYGFISLVLWVLQVLLGRDTSPAIRAQIVQAPSERRAVERRAELTYCLGMRKPAIVCAVLIGVSLIALGLNAGLTGRRPGSSCCTWWWGCAWPPCAPTNALLSETAEDMAATR